MFYVLRTQYKNISYRHYYTSKRIRENDENYSLKIIILNAVFVCYSRMQLLLPRIKVYKIILHLTFENV